jgi:hypothetical protein
MNDLIESFSSNSEPTFGKIMRRTNQPLQHGFMDRFINSGIDLVCFGNAFVEGLFCDQRKMRAAKDRVERAGHED